MERPRAVTNLALILGLIGVSALGGVINLPFGQPLQVAPQFLRTDAVTTGRLIFGAATIYCGVTLIAAYSLWRMRPWARSAYLWFVVSIASYMVIFCYLIRIPTPFALGLVFFGVLCGGLYLGWRVVTRAFPSGRAAL
jgi:hypothetical protein